MSELTKLTKYLEELGLTLLEISDRPPYDQRKGKTYGVFYGDRLLCSYSTLPRIKTWVRERLTR